MLQKFKIIPCAFILCLFGSTLSWAKPRLQICTPEHALLNRPCGPTMLEKKAAHDHCIQETNVKPYVKWADPYGKCKSMYHHDARDVVEKAEREAKRNAHRNIRSGGAVSIGTFGVIGEVPLSTAAPILVDDLKSLEPPTPVDQ